MDRPSLCPSWSQRISSGVKISPEAGSWISTWVTVTGQAQVGESWTAERKASPSGRSRGWLALAALATPGWREKQATSPTSRTAPTPRAMSKAAKGPRRRVVR